MKLPPAVEATTTSMPFIGGGSKGLVSFGPSPSSEEIFTTRKSTPRWRSGSNTACSGFSSWKTGDSPWSPAMAKSVRSSRPARL